MQNQYLVQARALRADILGAPTVWLPRRELLLEWLSEFVTRVQKSAYEPDETETGDLVALDQFLRKKKVPVAA